MNDFKEENINMKGGDNMNKINKYNNKLFEDIKHYDEDGNEYWLARELMTALEYKEWRKFDKVIRKAIDACKGSDYRALDHFVIKDKMVTIGSNTSRKIQDYKLSRYACYLIVQTEAKLKRDKVNNEYTANSIHYEVGKEVRDTIKRLGGIMPEDLPTPSKSLKELEKDNKKGGSSVQTH